MTRPAHLTILLSLWCATAGAVNVVVDYTYDSTGFFSTANSNGQKARATIEAAAGFYSDILDDSFAQIETPSDYVSTAPNSPSVNYSWNWEMKFNDPTTGNQVSLLNQVIPANEYRIYVGARSLSESTLGQAGPGGYQASSSGGYYFDWQQDDIQEISEQFSALLANRGQAEGDFGSWGGQLAFNNQATWNYDYTAAPGFGQNDLYSVAIHELGHALGFGTSDEFASLRSGFAFTGANARAANGGSNPTLSGGYGHWTQSTDSTVFGGTASQQAAMTPSIQTGSRKLLTELDAAALMDIGWQVIDPPGLDGDYNHDNRVDAADYAVWRNGYGAAYDLTHYQLWRENYGQSLAPPASGASGAPEPTCVALAFAGVLGLRLRRSRTA